MPPNGSRVFAESIIRGCLHISRRRSSHQTHHRPSPGAILENLFHLRKLPSRALCTRVRYQPIEYVEDLSGYCHGGYHPVLIGDQLNGGRYRVVHKLGYGGYSTVWLALDLRANRYVAVKIITAGASEESRKAKLFSSFNDWVAEPGSEVIPSLIDEFWVSGPNGHHRCLITAPARMSLFDSKDASPCSLLQLNVARSIIAQLVYGVSFLHGQDIVHGDLHLGNILVRLSKAIDGLSTSELYEEFGEPGPENVARVDGKPLPRGVPSSVFVPGWFGIDSDEIVLGEERVTLIRAPRDAVKIILTLCID